MDRFARALERFDQLNAEGPRDAHGTPREVAYAARMSACLLRSWPEASEALRLAVHAQHLARFRLPRADYPEGREGYRAWRKAAGRMHAQLAVEVLEACGYEAETCERVAALIRKERFKVDAEAQILEDVACLVFLEHELPAFAERHDDDAVVAILRKTWPKMSEEGQRLALGLALPPRSAALVGRALAKSAAPDEVLP